MWCIVKLHVLESLDRLFAQSSHKLRQGNTGNVILRVPHILKQIFEVNAVGKEKMPGIVAEDKLLFQMDS